MLLPIHHQASATDNTNVDKPFANDVTQTRILDG